MAQKQQPARVTVTTDFMVNTLSTLVDTQKKLIGIFEISLGKKEELISAETKRADDAESRVAQLTRQLESLNAELELKDNVSEENQTSQPE